MEERIQTRLAELIKAERTAEIELIVVRNLIAELQKLLAPAPVVTSGTEDAR
jgi:hypothetical protein